MFKRHVWTQFAMKFCVVAVDGRDQLVAFPEALMLTFKAWLILLFFRVRTPLCLEMHFFVIMQRELNCRAGRVEGSLSWGRVGGGRG